MTNQNSREDIVHKSMNKSKQSMVASLSSRMRKLGKSAINFSEWGAVAFLLIQQQGGEGMRVVNAVMPSLLQRLCHPWNAEAVRYMALELMLALTTHAEMAALTRPAIVNVFVNILKVDRGEKELEPPPSNSLQAPVKPAGHYGITV